MTQSIFLPDEAATMQQANILAKTLQAGDCVALSGDLGAGKSFFSRALMRALGVRDHALPSPSFSLIAEYNANNGLRIAHMDWYRLNDADEVIMLGVDDYFKAPWLSIVEWPKRAALLLPQTTTHIQLRQDDHTLSARWFTIA